MPEALFVNTVFSLGVTQWHNQKEVLPGNKAAYLASLEESSTLNEDLQSKWKHFNKNCRKSALFVCLVFFQYELPELYSELAPFPGTSNPSKDRKDFVLRETVLQRLEANVPPPFKKCFIHLNISSKKKYLNRDDNPSVADCTFLMMATREEQIRPWHLPPFLSDGFQRELEHSLLRKMNRTGELPSTPPLSRKELKFQRYHTHTHTYKEDIF